MLLLVRGQLSAGRAVPRLLGCTGNLPFQTVFTALDFLMGMDSTIRAISRSSLFSRLSLHQPPNLALRRKTESTFSHAGWTAGMECRSCSQDTGPLRRKRIDPPNLHGLIEAAEDANADLIRLFDSPDFYGLL